MLRVFAKRTGYCDRFGNLRVDKVSVTAFAAPVDKARSLKVVNKLSYFRRHQVTLCGSVALLEISIESEESRIQSVSLTSSGQRQLLDPHSDFPGCEITEMANPANRCSIACCSPKAEVKAGTLPPPSVEWRLAHGQ